MNLDSIDDLGALGLYAYVLSENKHSDELIQAMVIHKTVIDLKDLMGDSKITATLMECGTKILIEEPNVPNFFSVHTNSIFNNIDHPALQTAMKNNFQTKFNEISISTSRRTRKYILRLPDGMKCKMGYMNPMTNRRVLAGVMSSAHKVFEAANTGAADDFHNSMIMVTYVIAIDSEQQKIIRNAADVGNEVAHFFKRMSVNANPP